MSATDDADAMVKLLSERAFAKINLYLRVTGRRADGYHELDSIFVPISLSDRVSIEVRPASVASVTLKCNVASLGDAHTNLATRAARGYLREFDIAAQVNIDLQKTIPAGAGLGGGSSDAGTVLRMLASMLPPRTADAEERLHKIAVSLGADVPFFLNPRPSRVTGIGERIEALAKFPTLHLVVAVPPIEVPTVAVFKELRREEWSGPASGDVLDLTHLVNDLEAPAMRLFPEIAQLKASMLESGASAASMSGSGGAVLGIFPDEAAATSAATALRGKAPEAT
ncbi:MAG TPA: 4-(cytidine 5'-diphospho)-2-C-methyl-D-erythritol kinase, partial [Candidatus Binataceae bacterium]|nr:4-(cytidine 5'-diphospho)-2-C-methyl-D-erythritol kinase [Candidatus Binataceae bacterium]